ncbi:hypothetical protein PoB_005499100 [Plakobranchus ocellatus]|uniref:Uncharacterized protein n=1 Tax=Plakobranchus ocellatus TaxID=259542 RepID=A0AAV4CAY2_9GAST|nr:hypothetical protein PoB_005499100 [Plakobranchus ocellatus]
MRATLLLGLVRLTMFNDVKLHLSENRRLQQKLHQSTRRVVESSRTENKTCRRWKILNMTMVIIDPQCLVVKQRKLNWYCNINSSSGFAKTILKALYTVDEEAADKAKDGRTTSMNGQELNVRFPQRAGEMEKTRYHQLKAHPTDENLSG